MTASLFTGESLGYLLVGLLAFALGVCVTVLCVRLRGRERDDGATRSGTMIELLGLSLVQFLAVTATASAPRCGNTTGRAAGRGSC